MLTFENSPVQGTAGITEKLVVCSTCRGSSVLKAHICNRAFPSAKSSTRSPVLTPSPRARLAVSWSLSPADFWYALRLRILTGHFLMMNAQVDEEQRPMSYTQAFQLMPDGAGSYFVFNDIFRLIYAAA